MDTFKTYTEFLSYVEHNYEEEQQLLIEDFMSYYINKYRGYGEYNCESTYKYNLENDKTGELHKLAVIGFEFEKHIYDERLNKKISKQKQ
jgi:hypothetical protein